METLAIVATKGGVGKSTLAVHLAAAAQADGLRVLLLDLDQQGSAWQWSKDRARLASTHGSWFKTPLDVRRVFANDLGEEIERAETAGYDLVIIDTPPHADFPAARAAEVADLVLMPTRPGYFDLHAAKPTIKLLKDLKAHAFFVISQVPHTSPRIADDAIAFLESKGIAGAPGVITALQPYMRALSKGLTAPELDPEGRHAQEIAALWAFAKEEARRAHAARPPRSVRADRPAATETAILADPFADIIAALKLGVNESVE
jgi:chromosome partitioning protein